VVALACAGLSSPALAIGDFAVGGWKGAAYFKEAQFTHCAMLTKQGAWELLVSQHRNGAISVALHNKQLKFTQGHKLAGTIQLDAEPAEKRAFSAVRKDLVGAPLGASAERLSRAARLKIALGDIRVDFALSGAGSAFAQLASCVAKKGAH